MKTAIVTGANGFVGSALTNKLSSMGTKVYAIIRNKSSNIDRISQSENIHIIYCEMKDIQDLEKLIKEAEIDCFFHFAWEGSSGDLRGSYFTQTENIKNSCNAMYIAETLNCNKFIFASSVMEYEYSLAIKNSKIPPISNLYSTAKKTAHDMLRIIANTLNLNFSAVIISNIYGENESSPRIINTSIRRILNKETIDFTKCEQMYDFIYIDDAINAIISASIKGKINQDYYIGSLEPKKLKLFIKQLCDEVDKSAKINFGKIPFYGVSLNYNDLFDINALSTDTGFVPKYTFQQGIKKTTTWIKKDLENGKL